MCLDNSKIVADYGYSKQWAHKHLIEPLTAPEPFQEIGSSCSHKAEYTLTATASNSNKAVPRVFAERYPFDKFDLAHSVVVKQIQKQPAYDICSSPSVTMATASTSQHRRVVSAGSNSHRGRSEDRPLDTLKRETRMADRRHRKRFSNADIIDRLDMSTPGPAYHHEGPYDAVMASRNSQKKYAPLEAVRDSNREAIRATPRAYMQDCIDKHYPLQGTSTVPSGSYDSAGNMMTYSEGADLMREPDAAGGAYRRWDGIKYHPDDLKGKGEPSFTLERDLKARERKMLAGNANEVEMQSLLSNEAPHARRHSNERGASHQNNKDSSVAEVSGYHAREGDAEAGPSDMKRRLSNGIRKRIGSIKRKVMTEEPAAA